MLRIAGVLAVMALGMSAAHTKGMLGEGQLALYCAHLRVRYSFIVGGHGQRACVDTENWPPATNN